MCNHAIHNNTKDKTGAKYAQLIWGPRKKRVAYFSRGVHPPLLLDELIPPSPRILPPPDIALSEEEDSPYLKKRMASITN